MSSPRRIKSRRTARKQKRKLQNRRLDSRRYRGTEVAEVARSVIRQERGSRMTSKPAKVHTPMADRPVRQRPVRVKLTRADAFVAATYPPDGETENWWRRLNEALGTMSSDFVNASLLQLQAAARSPFGTISQIGCARHSDGLHPYGRHVDPFQTGQRTRNGATNCRLRISRGSFDENVCDAGRGSPTLASWGPPICPRRTRPCE